jgi:enoyl-CoA hydratase/carnithine racemase
MSQFDSIFSPLSSKALDAGLVNDIVPADKLVAHTKDLASRIAKVPTPPHQEFFRV